jgi:hypothetical protein
MIYKLLRDTDKPAADMYSKRANTLISDTLRECLSPQARLMNGVVDWGEGGWETLLMVLTYPS